MSVRADPIRAHHRTPSTQRAGNSRHNSPNAAGTKMTSDIRTKSYSSMSGGGVVWTQFGKLQRDVRQDDQPAQGRGREHEGRHVPADESGLHLPQPPPDGQRAQAESVQ